MNVELLNRVKTIILNEPRSFNMSDWVSFDGTHEKILGQPCGTVCCIAGWTAVLAGVSPAVLQKAEEEDIRMVKKGDAAQYQNPTSLVARLFLQLTEDQADSLFWITSWPDSFKFRYIDATSEVERAEIAAKRIDAFIREYDPVSPVTVEQQLSHPKNVLSIF